MQLNIIIFVGLMLLYQPAFADYDHDDHRHTHRELGAHEHGVGTLKIVMEDRQLKAYLESPAINLLGFEHQPANASEQRQLDTVLKQLQQAEQLIDIKGGECQLARYDLSNPFAKATGHEKPGKQPNTDQHSDFDVEYLFTCQQPLALESITIRLFDYFNGFDTLNAQWIINSTSGAAVFDKHQHVLKVN